MAAIQINQAQFEQLIQGEIPVLVDFWAPWCGYCRKIDSAYDRVADENPDLIVAKVNIDHEPQLTAVEQIEVVPTLVLYRNGSALDSIVAPDSKPMIEQFLRKALARAASGSALL